MKIKKIRVKNFRLLKDVTLDLREALSLLIGKNNSGKTSLIMVLEKFFQNERFDLNDFPICQRDKIFGISEETPDAELAIQLIIQIHYDENDNLSSISELILDIDESINTVNILFECRIEKQKLLKHLSDVSDKEKYILKNIDKYMDCKVFVFEDDGNFDIREDTFLYEKSRTDILDVINLQIIHAKRNVSSSEETNKETKVLSNLTTKFFNLKSDLLDTDFHSINNKMSEMDVKLNESYSTLFQPFLKNAKDFLSLDNLRVISDIKSKELISNSSRVVYGDEKNTLPEHLNGLGFMNILFLLLQIEMRKDRIEKEGKQINILIIEEPGGCK